MLLMCLCLVRLCLACCVYDRNLRKSPETSGMFVCVYIYICIIIPRENVIISIYIYIYIYVWEKCNYVCIYIYIYICMYAKLGRMSSRSPVLQFPGGDLDYPYLCTMYICIYYHYICIYMLYSVIYIYIYIIILIR